MFRPLKLFVPASVALTLLGKVACLSARELPPAAPTVNVKIAVENGNIKFSWPVMFGKWGLYEQPAPSTGEWNLIAEEKYQTNNNTVSVSLPVPQKTTYYVVKRVKRHVPPPSLPQLPTPAKPRNRPATSPPPPPTPQ